MRTPPLPQFNNQAVLGYEATCWPQDKLSHLTPTSWLLRRKTHLPFSLSIFSYFFQLTPSQSISAMHNHTDILFDPFPLIKLHHLGFSNSNAYRGQQENVFTT